MILDLHFRGRRLLHHFVTAVRDARAVARICVACKDQALY